MEIIPPRLKEPLYRVYELRLRQGLAATKSELPRHIAVLCDGNRRWARNAGYDDVSYGYRMGAVKIAEMLRWCQEAGIEMTTVYLLSTSKLKVCLFLSVLARPVKMSLPIRDLCSPALSPKDLFIMI